MDRRENEQFSLDSNKWSKRTLKSSIGGFSQPAVNQIRTLQGLLAVIQLLQLKQFIGSQLYHEEFLGEGVSYKVFRCQLAVSRKVVALKQVKLPPPDADIDAFRTRVSCVLKDIEVMNHAPLASHPHIIDLLGYGWNRQGSIPFLVTEWARHETMRQLLQGTSLSARQKLKLCRHVALALLELHLCGIAHGDVKLDNVLIVRASRGEPDYVTLADDTVVIAKLADFGHSVLLNPGEVVNADASQKYRGTVAYNAPELETDQQSDSLDVDFRKCDVWSLGLLCLEALRSGVYYTGDEMILSMISQSSVSNGSSTSPGASFSSRLDSKESLAIKMQISQVAISIAKNVYTPSTRISFIHTFRHCLSFKAQHRLADLSRLPLLAPGVYAEIPASRSQLREKVEETHPWSFETLRPLEAKTLVAVAKAQIVSDAEASMEREPSARRAFQIALAHATGYGVPQNHSMFLEWADRSSKMGFSIASLTLEIINSGHVCRSDQPHLQRGFNEIIVEAFRKLYHNTERIAGFSLSAELFPPPTTASEGFNSRSNKRASRLAHANGTLSTVWEPEAVRDKHKNQVASDVNTLNPFSGDTPLLGAARMGDLVAAKALLDAGADPSIAGKDGSVPLHWLFMFPKSNHEQIARHLGPADKAAATVHRRVKFPQRLDAQFPVELFGTPLSFAVATASLSAVEALLKIGASPTADAGIENSTSWHRSPLELAASLHLHTVLENLLRALGTTDLPDNLFLRLLGVMTESSIFERRCIHGAATATACQDTVSTICFYPETLPVKPDKTVDDLKAGISAAIARADTEVATALVDEFEAGFPHSANIQNRAQFIREAALLSAVNSHCANILDSSTTLELVNSAIEDRLDVERFNATRRAFDSQNPIFVAIENQRDDLLKFLKGKGIDICSKDPKGRSALHNIYINKLTWLSAKTIISLGFEVDERDDNSATPLYYAAMYGGPGEVKELVSMSAAVNACDDQGFTPLHQAIRGWDLPTIHCLLDLGADPTMFDKTGRAPIHLAAVDPRGLAIFKCLAHSGVSGEIKTKDGQDCIALASLSGNNLLVEEMITSELSGSPEKLRHPDVLVQQLVLRSSDALSISSCNGRAPLRYAARNGLENVVRLLRHILSSHNISKRDSSGRIALSLAAANGHTGVVKILFGLGPSSMIESTDEDGRGALSLAAGNGHVETVRELLKHTTKHNAQCRHGRTALSWAAGNGHTQVVAELLQAPRLDADSEGIYGRTPLSWAAGNGHAQVVAELLQVPRLDADSKGISDGRTPLSLAAGNGHIKVAKLLLESGRCTGDMTDRSGRSALSWAAGNGHLAMVEYLLSVPGSHREVWAADINGRSPVWWALRFSHTLIAKALVAQEYSKFQNRLLEAVQYGHLAVVEFLLDPRHLPHSYDVESRDARGRTALLVATEAGHSDIFFALMSVGRAKANVRDYQGRTPLYWAAKGGHLSMVKKLMLVLDPDDINWSASDGLTALSIARINGHVDVIAALSPDSGGVEPPPAQTTKITTTASATTHGTVDLDEKCDVKMVVVGEPGALKTRLCYAMAENKVRDKASYIPTVFPPCDISFETDKKQYMATLLDTAGQEDYDRLRPLSYPQTDVFIMCFPLSTHPRNDMIIDNLRTKWVPEIRHFCPHAPFLLVGVLDTDDELWESYRVALGTKLGEGEKLAKELGALEYLECDPIVTMAGVQEVFKTAIASAFNATIEQTSKQKSSRRFWRRRP